MVLRHDLSAWLDEYLSVSSVTDYQPNGLQVEGKEKIRRIAGAVSVNLEVIERAVSEKADAVLVHHGMFWKSDDVTLTGYRKQRVARLLSHDINLFAYHLPLDLNPEVGHNALILKGIGASLEPPEEGYGRRGILSPPVRFETLLQRIGGLLSGAGRNEIDTVSRLGVDAYITGDAKESTPYIARETKMNYIYAGHYRTEKLGVETLLSRIRDRFHVETGFHDIENDL
jgi:putative NIF3 family GTP cyclohydrolase 1 type 2